MNRKKLPILVGGLLALTMSVSAPAAADAGETAYNSKTQYLSEFPQDHWDTSCVDRRIDLAAGTYDWEQFGHVTVVPLRTNFQLGAGGYTWTDCFDPKDGFYVHTSWLDPDNPNWATASGSIEYEVRGSAEYAWGSLLRPQSFSASTNESPDASPMVVPRAG